MLPRGGSCKAQRPSKQQTSTAEKGTRHRPKLSLLSTVKANNRALAAALDDTKQLCSKLKDEILCLRREKHELCETISNLKLQLQSQHLDTRSLQTVVDHLTAAQQSITQANICLTSRHGNRVHMSLSPISARGGGSHGAANSSCKVVACPMEVDRVQFLSPPGNTSSPSGHSGHVGHTSSPGELAGLTSFPSGPAGQHSHLSLLDWSERQDGCAPSPGELTGHTSSGPAEQPGHIFLPDWSERQCGSAPSPSELKGHAGYTSLVDWSTERNMCSAVHGTEMLRGIPYENEKMSSLERRDELNLDFNVEEEGMNSSSTLTQRPKRKCAPLSSSMVEPSLRDKLRRGDPFTTSFTTWSPCDPKDRSKSKKRYSAKRVALANITNKVMN